jgi:hypothetical protein
MMDRLRNLPTWLRVFLAALPLLMCIPVACIVVFVYQQYTGTQQASATAAAAETSAAQAATQAAVDAAAELTAAAQEASDSLTQAAIEQSTADASSFATAAALAIEQQNQTATAESATLTAAVTDTPAVIAPTETATHRPSFATATPKTITITLRECRGDEGVLFFGQAQPQSFHSFSSLSFTVPPGTYHIRIDWKAKPENNVNSDFKLDSSQTLNFGDQCQ